MVYVEWEDSYGCSSRWEPVESGDPEVLMCKSVGWLTHKRKKLVVVVPHLALLKSATDRQGCGDMTIPTACIRRMMKLPTLPVLNLG